MTLRIHLLISILALCALPETVFASSPETGFLNRSITLKGAIYRYQVFVPRNWSKQKSWPVILFLHGSGERGDDGSLQTSLGLPQAIRQNVSNFPFIVVMPQCWNDRVWTDPAMEAQAFAALNRSLKEFHGDPKRLYLTGTSMGGFGTLDFGAYHPEKFAALVVVCGGVRPLDDWPQLHGRSMDEPNIADPFAETARRIGKTPVWLFHGNADPTVPVEQSRKMYAALKAAGDAVEYTEYPGVAHNSWEKAYAEPKLIPWLLQQSLKH